MRNESMRGYLDAIVLSILHSGDSYGYDIAQQVNNQTQGALLLKEGSLYPALKRLESGRFIEGYWGMDKDTGPRRRYYTITERGNTRFKELYEEWRAEQKLMFRFFRRVVMG